MKIERLKIFQFRNIHQIEIVPHPSFNFFYGDNAQGKTSILEAISFLSELKSFRTTQLSSLIQHNQQGAFIESSFFINELPSDLKIKIQPEGKDVFLNGKTPRPFRKLRSLLPTVLFTPESVRLFRVNPGDRRHYFDSFFGLFCESFAQKTTDYQQTLIQKTKLIEQIREGFFSKNAQNSKALLSVWNQKLAQLGALITLKRWELTNRLANAFKVHFKNLSLSDWESELAYQPYFSKLNPSQTQEEIQDLFLKEMEIRYDDEITRGKVLVGPHRDDWILQLGGLSLKEEGSQGQHRISVAALKMAEVDVLVAEGKSPMALLDDLLSELDDERIRAMFHFLAEMPCQVFLTSVAPFGLSAQKLPGLNLRVVQGELLN